MNYRDIEDDYKHEQAYFNKQSSVPFAKDGMVPRFFKGTDCPDKYSCDVVYIDRKTGLEVLRYDGADPANTRFDYGASSDSDVLASKGLDIKEMIQPSECAVSLEQCSARMNVSYDFDDYDCDCDEDYD